MKASHILVGTKEEADTIHKELTDQKADRRAFSTAARKYSKDPTTKTLGGDVGWFRQAGQMDRAFTEAALALKVGEMSPPVQTQFGWHIIFLTDRRETAVTAPPAPPAPRPVEPGHEGHDHPHPHETPAPAPSPGAPNPNAPGATPTPEVAAVLPKAVSDPQRSRRLEQMSFRLSIETVQSQAGQVANSFTPEKAAELNLSLKNESSKEQKFFARELLPMGFKVTPLGEAVPLVADFAGIAEPASFFTTLKSGEITGMELSLNDYYKNLAQRRYQVTWDVNTLITNLDARFPKAKEQPDHAVLSETAKKQRTLVVVDNVVRDASPRLRMRTRPLSISYFDALTPTGKHYAQFKLAGGAEPIVIQLYNEKQFNAARHFAALISEGFYDGLTFFDSEDGDYVIGGCPTNTGTGAPNGMTPPMRNDAKLPHKAGTVTLVSRSVRTKGPVRGGQVGSIFAICLKPHPEWDEEHVPVGEVVSGLSQLEKLSPNRTFSEVTLLTEGELKTRPAATPAAQVAGNPTAVIKTSKGSLTVELFEDVARNTVANFVTLADQQKFYDKATQDGAKQKIFVMKDDAGKPFIAQTGSPTNDLDSASGPGYSIPGEVNAKKHVKGALAMVVAYDSTNKAYVPDTAGSQFFICLSDLPYYDYLKTFTVFGQVTQGLDVLDKLADGDTIESVEITNKKATPYSVRKINSP